MRCNSSLFFQVRFPVAYWLPTTMLSVCQSATTNKRTMTNLQEVVESIEKWKRNRNHYHHPSTKCMFIFFHVHIYQAAGNFQQSAQVFFPEH